MTEWAPVVYGRTLVADRWWRALPSELNPDHWAAKVVLATVAGGAGLTRPRADAADERGYAPRLAFARGTDGTLVGVACRARQLREDLSQDEHERELYCFVGWFTADRDVRGIPSLTAFEPGPESWASEAYYEYTEAVWRTRAAKLSILPSKSGPAPWADPAAEQPASDPPAGPPQAPNPPNTTERLAAASSRHVLVFPAADAGGLWQLANESAGPFILVTGWQRLHHAPLDQITVLTADDVAKGTAVPRPAVPVKAAAPAETAAARQQPDAGQDAAAETRHGAAQQRRPGAAALPKQPKQPKSRLLDRLSHALSRVGDDHDDDVWSDAADRDRPTSETPTSETPSGQHQEQERQQEPRTPLPPVEPELPARRGKKELFEGLDDF